MAKGGWVADVAGVKLGDGLRQDFERHCAPADFGAFVTILRSFAAGAADADVRPAALRDELDRVAAWAVAQQEFLGSISEDARDALAVESLDIVANGAGRFRHQLHADLGRFAALAEVARRRAEAATSLGRGSDPKRTLALVLARLIDDAGLPLETKKGAAWRRAYGLALDALGVIDSHEGKTLQSALKAWRAENGNNAPAAP